MIALAGAVLAASLVGSPHCAAMCGGFVCFVAGQEEGRRLRVQLAYHAGRLVAYAALGFAAGALGSEANRLGVAAGLGHSAAPVAGALMMAWGGAGLAGALGARWPRTRVPAGLHAVVVAVLRAVSAWPPLQRALVMGLVTALLPCGFLWAFVAIAAGAGSPAAGALVLAVFWTGTLPVMLGLGALARAPLGWLRRRAPVVTAALLVVLGGLTMTGKLLPPAAAPGGACCHAHAPR